MKKMMKRVLASTLAATIAMTATSMIASAAWEKSASGTWSWTENGQKATGWRLINGKWYFMDQNGDMATGWKLINGKWYFLKETGDMVTGWKLINGKWYFLNENGDMATGWKMVNGKWYFLNENGDMRTGWLKDAKGDWYYLDSTGAMETGFFEVNGKTYFASASGDMQTGVVEIDGNIYYFGEENDGAMKTGYVEIDGKLYRFGEDGQCDSVRKPVADVAFTTNETTDTVVPVTPTVPDKPSGGSVIIPPASSDNDDDKEDTTVARVSTAAELEAALSNTSIKRIVITQSIGSAEEYGIYRVERPVAIESGTVYGSFVVVADGVSFDGVTIKNKGDATNTKADRNAINFVGSEITIKNCVFDASDSTEFANGVSIFPTETSVNYTIIGNTFKAYDDDVESFSPSGITIASGVTINESYKAFFGVTKDAVMPNDVDDYTIATGNQFIGCSIDYSRDDWKSGNKVYARSISNGDNLLLQNAAEEASYYVTGNITRDEAATVKAGTTLTVTAGKTLTAAANITVEEGGALVGETGSVLVVNSGVTVDDKNAGIYTWDGENWVKDAGTALVGTEEELETALSGDAKEIVLTQNIDTTKTISVDREVVIDGNGKTLEASNLNSTPGQNSALLITADGVKVENLVLDAAKTDVGAWGSIYTIQVYEATGVVLNNVTAKGGNGGIIVNGSDVTLEGTTDVSGNGFGGIEVSKGVDVESDPVLTVNGTIVYADESLTKPAVWIDKLEGTVNWEGHDPYHYTESGKNQYFYFVNNDLGKPVVEMAEKDEFTVTEKVAAEENGKITEYVPVDENKVAVSLKKGVESYTNVRFVVEVEGEAADGLQLIAQDTSGNWYDIAVAGWGIEAGFPIADATTNVYVTANKAGTYHVTVKLVDVKNDSAVLAEVSGVIEAVEAPVTEEETEDVSSVQEAHVPAVLPEVVTAE
ncbi:MAG: pectate lyase-like adhesive domain-containing protein [Candidatus Merdivicinus sp.]|jgi:hypothetical protein